MVIDYTGILFYLVWINFTLITPKRIKFVDNTQSVS